MNNSSILRFNALKQITGLSRSTVWRLERAGTFPKRRQISANTVGWLSAEVDSWINSRGTVGGGP